MPYGQAGTIWQIRCIPTNLRRSGVGRTGDNRQVLVEVSSRRFTVPFECPCCGAVPDTELPIQLTRLPGRTIARDTAHSLLVPYCRRCIGHVAMWESAGVPSAAAVLLGLVGGIVLALAVHPAIGIAVGVVSLPVAWLVRKSRQHQAQASRGASCATTARAVSYLGWSGTTTAVDLESHTYAARFAEANPSLLAAKTAQLDKLLDAHRVARLAVPSAVAEVVPPPASVQAWIVRLDASTGTVARRATLLRALDALVDLGERQLVIQATMKLEVAPVLDEIAHLESSALKSQRLQRAIDDIRVDNIPEALQRAVLFELEGHLRAIKPDRVPPGPPAGD